ncbi:MAG: hypothetical protein ABI867_07270 [Kofleriaceae bacterium]
MRSIDAAASWTTSSAVNASARCERCNSTTRSRASSAIEISASARPASEIEPAAQGYPDAHAYPAAPREPAGTTTIFVEGLSARYLPIAIGERSRLVVAPTNGIRIAGWIVATGGGLGDGSELDADLAVTLDPGTYTLVVTGLSRATITTAVELVVTPAPVDPGGCSTTSGSMSPSILAILAIRRRRRIRRPGT